MSDTLYSPVLSHVMVPKETYDSFFSFVESHSDHRTLIPDARFVNYNESFDMMTQFIEDAITAINQNNYSNDDISIATQKFVTETAALWPKEPVYHNRILKFMESAYQIPNKAKELRNQLIIEHPELTDAITYMTRKYLESYMEHVIKEIDYIDSYINSDVIIPMQESFDYDFKGYYLAEDLGSQIAAIPGMILALIKKLMNSLSLSLSEASKKFAARILTNNQINEEAIQNIYKLYQAKGRSNAQSPIRYPDPKQVNQLRQSYAVGFKAFTDQMIDAINTDNFTTVDQGVVKMVSNFRVVTSNQTLPISASYQEFRTAILSIANNILLMDDFMKALIQIDDAITQKYGSNPDQIKKTLGVKLEKQTQINKDAAQSQQESVSEELFNSMFDVMTEAQKLNVRSAKSNHQNSTSTSQSGKPNHQPNNSNPQPSNSNSQNNGNSNKKPEPSDDKEARKAAVKRRNRENLQQAADDFKVAATEGVKMFAAKGLPQLINKLITQFIEVIANNIIPNAAEAISNMLGFSSNESVDFLEDDIISLFEADQPVQQQQSSQQPAQQVQTNEQPSDQQNGEQPVSVPELGVNDDGSINSNIFSLEFLNSIIKKLNLDGIYANFNKAFIGLVENYIISKGGKQNNQGSQNAQNTQPAQQSQPTQNMQPQQPTNESYFEFEYDEYMTEAKFGDFARGVITGAAFKLGKAKVTKTAKTLLSSTPKDWAKNIMEISMSVCGRLNLIRSVGTIQRYVQMQMEGKDGIGEFRKDTELQRNLATIATVALGVTGVVVVQMCINENPVDAVRRTVANVKANKVPKPKRAMENISNTRQAVPDIVSDLWNKMANPVKNLYMFVNGWLYGGQSIKGSREKTVGIAEIIRQEIESLAPYVNMTDVIQFNTEPKL